MIKDGTIIFGSHKWQVLHVNDDNALIITKDIIELRWYHCTFAEVTWEQSEIRKYLNDEFYNTFNEAEKARISTVTNANPNNPWFKTKGGTPTTDKIFLLSLDEVCQYFGNSIEKLQNKDIQKWYIDDENNTNRQAKFKDKYHWWRLRSPGYYSRTAASVNGKGFVYVRGNGVFGTPKDGGGIRPALWLKKICVVK